MARAYVDRNGLITFTNARSIPKGMLLIAAWPNESKLREVVEAGARHGYEPGVLLVPGVPEAEDDSYAALNAVFAFRDQTHRRLQGLPAYERRETA